MMAPLTLSQLFPCLPAKLSGADVSFHSVSTDTRQVKPGDLFIALSGERFDGNRFVKEAQDKGACAAIVSAWQDVAIPQLLVRDTVQALGWIGHLNRSQSQAQVVAITGSQGKTTVKELTGAILSRRYRTLVTRGNLNNSIGAPQMLLELDASHERAVIELGANAQGEIAWGTRITNPEIVLLNNAAETHVEGFGGLQGVVKGKGEIIDSAPATHTVILNADDDHVGIWLQRAVNRRVVLFSGTGSADADYRATSVELLTDGSRFELVALKGSIVCFLPLAGCHNVSNAVAAAALAIEAGASLVDVRDALAAVKAVDGRLKPMAGMAGSRLIDDTYNASPASFKAAIDVLCQISQSQSLRSVLIAGDMAELGDIADRAHLDLGKYAREMGVDQLWCTGKLSARTAEGFGEGAWHFDSKDALARHAVNTLDAGMVVLVKGSRSAGMEDIVNKIRSGETR
jgi:UDP-N-acetylmuramoyl-tripeptide--D-alanyl-D-alanine ligase